MALVPFLLPFQALCGVLASGQPAWFPSSGLFVCAQPEGVGEVRVKLPPSRGQFRVLDCEQDLTPDGTPDDFNRNSAIRSFLFFRFARVFPNESFNFRFPRTASQNACPVVLSTAGEDSGTQKAIVDYFTPAGTTLEVRYACRGKTHSTYTGSPWSSGFGAGGCVTLEGAQAALQVSVPAPRGTLKVVSKACGLTAQQTFGPADLVFKDLRAWVSFPWSVPEGLCPMSIEVTAETTTQAQIIFVGHSRDRAEIDTPRLVQDGDRRRIIAPLFSTAFDAHVLVGDKAIWRSQSESRNPAIPRDLPTGAKICAAAWGRENSVSTACFEANNGKEVPYDFR